MKNELAAAWMTSALADLKSIEHLKNDEFLTHIVAFHAQQCVEKCFKAFLETRTGEVPRIHSTLKGCNTKKLKNFHKRLDSITINI
jgi:HEPN domain-containing protein